MTMKKLIMRKGGITLTDLVGDIGKLECLDCENVFYKE